MNDHEIREKVDALFDGYRARYTRSSRRCSIAGICLSFLLTPTVLVPLYRAFSPSEFAVMTMFVLVGYGVYLVPVRLGQLWERRFATAMAQAFEEAFPRNSEPFGRALHYLDRHKPTPLGSVEGMGEVAYARQRLYRWEQERFGWILGELGADAVFEEEVEAEHLPAPGARRAARLTGRE